MTRAMLVPVGAKPHFVDVDGLKSLQQYVGGCIAACGWIFDDEPTVYVNDEGKFTQPPNRAVISTERDTNKIDWNGNPIKPGTVLDVIFGDFVCIGFDPETGEDRDISDEEAERVRERFGSDESIMSGLMEVLKIKARA